MSDIMSTETAAANPGGTETIEFNVATALTTNEQITLTWSSAFYSGPLISDIAATGITWGANGTGTTSTAVNSSPGASTIWGASWAGNTALTLTTPSSGFSLGGGGGNGITVTIGNTHAVNPAANAYTLGINVNSGVDTGTLAIPIISNGTVTIDATVAPTISFSNSVGSSLHFGTITPSTITYANTTSGTTSAFIGSNFSIATNATTGYTLGYNSTYGSGTLTSATSTIPAMAGAALSTSTPGYGMAAAVTGGGTLATGYTYPGTYKAQSSVPAFVTQTSPTAGDTVAVYYAAVIGASQPAGFYTETNVWTATGNF
jgi:hypothetical protein